MKPFRIKITEMNNSGGWKTYLTRTEKGCISYFTGDQTPIALSNLVGTSSAELHFMLQDAEDGPEACVLIRRILAAQWAKNPSKTPTVELWKAPQ